MRDRGWEREGERQRVERWVKEGGVRQRVEEGGVRDRGWKGGWGREGE